MFEIDDNFLQSIGYDVAALSDEEKDRYKGELTEELQTRISERMGAELEEEQVNDLEGIQNSPARANEWLNMFHADYQSSDEYQQIVRAVGEEEGKVFYASALWMQYAVPDYGKIVANELDTYQQELIEKRAMVNEALGIQ